MRGSGCRGGVRTAWVPRGPHQVREKLVGVFGGPLAGRLLLCPYPEIIKVSGFLGLRLRAGSGQESPPRALGMRLGGASCLHPQLFSELPRPRHSSSRRRPPPPRRMVTLRAAVLRTLSPRPRRVTPLILGFCSFGAPQAGLGLLD